MAIENKILDLSFTADEDLSSDQYRLVVTGSSELTVKRPDAITDIALGVLQNAPESGEAAVVRMIGSGGVSKIVLGATLAAGAIVAPEYQSASDAGKAQAAVSTQYPAGVLIMGGAEDDLGSVLLTPITVVA
jgi:hypothetical protein